MMAKCSHCHLEFPDEVMIKEGDLRFCCKGCKGVYHLIHDKDLDSYYSKVGNRELAPPKEGLIESSSFDSESFQNRYLKERKDGFFEISLHIEGIHCSACVWLNEQILFETDGIIEANINFSTNRAKIVFDKKIILLSQIVETIRSIGYDATPFEKGENGKKLDRERKDYYIRLAVGIFGVMNIMWISIALYSGYFTGIEQNIKTILNIAEWILSTPVLFFSGWIFFRGAYFGLKNRVVNMDILIATGSLLTYLYSIYITLFELGEAYFDSVAMIITFILIGKFLELLSKREISESLDLISKYQPNEVQLLNGEKIAVEKLKKGDLIVVKSGERVGVDGKIIRGEGTLDEATITGESLPILKNIGDQILSGTLLTDGYLEVEVEREFKESHIWRLVSLLEDALSKKPNIENLANKISGIFSITILSLSLLTFTGWFLYSGDGNISFITAVSVLIIACPCALALATPIATLIGLNMGTKRGILFKEARFLETMAKADILAIDKTGTITEGKPKVVNSVKFRDYNEKLLVSLLKISKHPISIGILDFIKNMRGVNLENIVTIPARGVRATYNETDIIGGNLQFMNENGIFPHIESNKSHFYYAENGEVKALFELEDTLRKDAIEGIEKIKSIGLEVVILSGDREEAVKNIADEVGVSQWKSQLKPEDKLAWILEKQKSGKIVVMVGDGVNDILALGSANIGIAIGSGTDIAMEIGDVVLQKDSIVSLFESFQIGRKTFSLIRQNLGISLVYNAITIPIAIAGFVIPLVASISMSLSSLLVVLNSFRAKREKNFS
jgi:Cu+-exporting ATPase